MSGRVESELSTRCELMLYVDQKGVISFLCDWDQDEAGVEALGDVLYKLKHEDLVDIMVTSLYKQCVLSNKLETFNKVLACIHQKVLNKSGDDKVVIRPTKAI